MEFKELQTVHANLRRYRYFYFVKNEGIISDFDYDILEKEYNKECDKLDIPLENRVSNYIGFDIAIPINLKLI